MNVFRPSDRNDRIRLAILEVLQIARGHSPTGSLGGLSLFDEVERNQPESRHFYDEGDFLSLCRDLVNLELAEINTSDLKERERFAPRHMSMRITAKGSQLLDGKIPPIPGIFDSRVADFTE